MRCPAATTRPPADRASGAPRASRRALGRPARRPRRALKVDRRQHPPEPCWAPRPGRHGASAADQRDHKPSPEDCVTDVGRGVRAESLESSTTIVRYCARATPPRPSPTRRASSGRRRSGHRFTSAWRPRASVLRAPVPTPATDEEQAPCEAPPSLPLFGWTRERTATPRPFLVTPEPPIDRGAVTSRTLVSRVGSDILAGVTRIPARTPRRFSDAVTAALEARKRRTAASLRMGGPGLEPGTSCL
jgi:hypothetical protein